MLYRSILIRNASTAPEEPAERVLKRRPKGALFLWMLLGLGVYTFAGLSRQAVDHARFLKAKYKDRKESAIQPDYKPLRNAEDIRVLVLHMGQKGDPIHCHLEYTNLANHSKYEALSYTWGDPNPRYDVHCSSKKVGVGRNLYQALLHLRRPDEERTLWVDALCINQRDAKEKSRQIPLMWKIYSQSENTLIWLGEADEETSNAFKTSECIQEYLRPYLARCFGEDRSLLKWLGFKRWSSLPGLRQREISDLEMFDWKPIIALLQNSWFRRVWVIQELLSARNAKFVCGDEELPYWTLMGPIVALVIQGLDREVLGPHVVSGKTWQTIRNLSPILAYGIRQDVNLRSTLLEWIATCSDRECTDTRDKIFAFRGIATDCDATDWEVLPDYTVPFEEICLRFARWCLLKKRDLACLSFAGVSRLQLGSHPMQPSWVPTWDEPLSARARLGTAPPGLYKASADSKPWLTWAPDSPETLRIRGRIIDKIDDVSITREQLIVLDHRQFEYGQELDSKYYKMFAKSGMPGYLIEYLKEAQAAVHRFGSERTPNHAITDVVWMANCRQIAAKDTGEIPPVRFEEFCRTITHFKLGINNSPRPKNFSKLLKEQIDFLDAVRNGRTSVSALPGTAYSLPRQRRAAANRKRQPPVWRRSQKHGSYDDQKHFDRRLLMHEIFCSVINERFCVTSHNRLGWVPLLAKPGDIVCVLNGASVPFILRPEVSDKKQLPRSSFERFASPIRLLLPPQKDGVDKEGYRLIGECYIHGVMNGEAMKMEGLEERIFELR